MTVLFSTTFLALDVTCYGWCDDLLPPIATTARERQPAETTLTHISVCNPKHATHLLKSVPFAKDLVFAKVGLPTNERHDGHHTTENMAPTTTNAGTRMIISVELSLTQLSASSLPSNAGQYYFIWTSQIHGHDEKDTYLISSIYLPPYLHVWWVFSDPWSTYICFRWCPKVDFGWPESRLPYPVPLASGYAWWMQRLVR